MESFSVKIVGVAPLLHHASRRFLNHLDPLTREYKALASKRKKTDDDLARLSDMEYALGLYVNGEGRPIIPGENVEMAIIAGAKKQKEGKIAQVGVTCTDAVLEYEGPKDLAGLQKDARFRDIRPVRVSQAMVCRTRPIFNQWTAKFEVTFDPSVVDKSRVMGWIEAAGQYSGLGDYRPRFGRFMVEAK